MALPRLIVCAESYSLDQETNLISAFHIIESLYFHLSTGPSEPQPPLPPNVTRISADSVSCIAVWTRDEADGPEDEFEAFWEIRMPGQPAPTIVDQRHFRFTKKNQRFILRLQLRPASENGLLRIASKIRRAGATEWQEQVTIIDVTVEGGE